MPTTSFPGGGAERPAWTTGCCSARTTTPWSNPADRTSTTRTDGKPDSTRAIDCRNSCHHRPWTRTDNPDDTSDTDTSGADTGSGRPAALDVSAAKVACSDAAALAARHALQVHGGIGYTLEHDLGLLLTRARALRSAWGTPDAHRGRVLAALDAGQGARP